MPDTRKRNELILEKWPERSANDQVNQIDKDNKCF